MARRVAWIAGIVALVAAVSAELIGSQPLLQVAGGAVIVFSIALFMVLYERANARR